LGITPGEAGVTTSLTGGGLLSLSEGEKVLPTNRAFRGGGGGGFSSRTNKNLEGGEGEYISYQKKLTASYEKKSFLKT